MRIHSKEKLFLFSQCYLCSIILELGFLPYPKLCVFTLRRINGNYLVSVVWKMATCWLFGGLFLCTNHSRYQSRSADTYMANREWGSYVIMGGLKRDGLSFNCQFLVTTIVGWRPACRTSFPHNPANVWGCRISSSQKI